MPVGEQIKIMPELFPGNADAEMTWSSADPAVAVVLEDGTIQGGMGSAVLEFMADHEYTPTVKRIGIPDKFVQHGTIAQLYQLCGMDEDSLTKELLKQCELLPDMSKIKELTN